jgi:hypothetical protein
MSHFTPQKSKLTPYSNSGTIILANREKIIQQFCHMIGEFLTYDGKTYGSVILDMCCHTMRKETIQQFYVFILF